MFDFRLAIRRPQKLSLRLSGAGYFSIKNLKSKIENHLATMPMLAIVAPLVIDGTEQM